MEGKIESGASLDRCLCNHAEANAIMHCAILGIEAGIEGAVLYTTFVPCLRVHKDGNNDRELGNLSALTVIPRQTFELLEGSRGRSGSA